MPYFCSPVTFILRITTCIPYSAKFDGVKLWRIDCFRVLARENVGKFTIANISYFSESGIWLGKILANGIPFTKSAKVFLHQNFTPYSIYVQAYVCTVQFNSNLTLVLDYF